MKKGIQVKASSSICKINPILDEGMLRVGGQISRLAMLIEMKNLIILPKGSHISILVLCDICAFWKKSYALHTESKILVA